jgi:hypothetical protein
LETKRSKKRQFLLFRRLLEEKRSAQSHTKAIEKDVSRAEFHSALAVILKKSGNTAFAVFLELALIP